MLLRYPCRRRCTQAAAAAAAVCTIAGQGFTFVPGPAPRERPAFRGDHCCSRVRHVSPRCAVVSTTASDRREEWREAVLPFLPPGRCRTASPADSLRRGEWFKLICGASFEDLPAVRDLALVYTLAGADCIDVAAEEAVIEAARDGVVAALGVAEAIGEPMRAPWLMVSVNDDEEDPHFRKAVFDPELCPTDCPRPCEAICPADAVVFPDSPPPPAQRAAMVEELLGASAGGGVLEPRCYGCGRCIAVCPPGIIRAEKYKRPPSVVRELLEKVDGVEIHTKGDLSCFREVWEGCVAEAASRPGFKVVAVSFPDLGRDTGLAVAAMGAVMDGNGAGRGDGGGRREASGGARRAAGTTGGEKGGGDEEMDAFAVAAAREAGPAAAAAAAGRALNVWQTDGRPMSGDIGSGATAACIRLAEKVLDARALPFGDGQHFVQLAGGTNDRTAEKLREIGLIGDACHDDGDGLGPSKGADQDYGEQRRRRRIRREKRVVGGVAYGGYARKAVGRALDRLPADGAGRVEDYPGVLSAALGEAASLVGGLKPERSSARA